MTDSKPRTLSDFAPVPIEHAKPGAAQECD
jgi:hypothetical protein